MEQKLKERLVGAAVLVAVAVFFIPIIFTDSPETEVISGSNIPEKPETNFNSRIIPVIESDDKSSLTPIELENIESENIGSGESKQNDGLIIKQKVVAEKVISAKENKAEKKLSTEVEGNTTVGLSAWIVQLGSFIEEDNAQSLNKKLRTAGYPSFVEPLKRDGKISYRVRVGPEIKRSEADMLLKKLKEKMQLNGIVVSYP
jgi:DedD protein